MCLNFALMAVGLVFCLLLFACVFGFWSAGWFLDWMLLLCGGGWAGWVGCCDFIRFPSVGFGDLLGHVFGRLGGVVFLFFLSSVERLVVVNVFVGEKFRWF